MIKVKGLDFGYGSEKILKNVNLNFEKGQAISLIGPNGSGKSTLLRCLCGLLPIENKKVYLFDKPIEEYKPKEISQNIGFLSQFQKSLNSITVYELVSMGRAPYHKSGWLRTKEDREKIDWAIDYMKIQHLKHRMLERLSGGEKQRVWIAMVLAQDTPIILLDEPVTYMDLKYQWDLLETIEDLKENYQKTIVSVFHDINHAIEISDYICLLKNGEVYAAGTSEEVITEKFIKEVYDIGVHVCKIDKCCKSVVVPIGLNGKGNHKKQKYKQKLRKIQGV